MSHLYIESSDLAAWDVLNIFMTGTTITHLTRHNMRAKHSSPPTGLSRAFVEPTLTEEATLADITLNSGTRAHGDPVCKGPPPKPDYCE